MKQLVAIALVALALVPLLLAGPVVAQTPGRLGPSFSATLGMAAQAPSEAWRVGAAAPSLRASMGIATRSAEIYVGSSYLGSVGPLNGAGHLGDRDDLAGDRTLEERLIGGMAGLRLDLLDGPIRVAPFFEAGVGWLESLRVFDGWNEGTTWGHDSSFQKNGWVRTMGGGVAVELALGGGFGLGLNFGATDVQAWQHPDLPWLGELRVYHGGATMTWSRRFLKSAPARPRPAPRTVSRPEREPVEGRPAAVVIRPATGPVRASAEVTKSADGLLEVVLSGASPAVRAVADRLDGRDDVRVRVQSVDPVPSGATDPPAVMLDVRLPTMAAAELLALAPGVDRIDVLTLRIRRASVGEGADFLELVVRLNR